MTSRPSFLFLLSLLLFAPAWRGADAADPVVPVYRPDPGFFHLPEGLELSHVAGVAFTSKGEIVVSHRGPKAVLIFSAEGAFVKSWGQRGTASGEFHLPHGILTGPDGLLHVADRENDRIQVFDQDGTYVREYGGFAPFGIFLAPGPLLYVADGRAHEVLVMTLEGKVLSRFRREGEAPGEFRLPHGIGLGPDGALYVTEI